MAFHTLISEFQGLPVETFDPENLPASAAGTAWRISIDWDAYEKGVEFETLFAKLLEIPGSDEIEAFIVGPWPGSGEGVGSEGVIESLVSAREQLPNLKCLFIGEILQEECEVSWITQSDLSPIFLAFPNLETLRVRGTSGLSLGKPVHNRLKHLVVEGGGMPGSIVREIGEAQLPELTHLEIWLGSDGYGNDVTERDLRPILDGKLFPKLKYLGLRNDFETDATVGFLKGAGVLDLIETLDLSLGTLTDAGATTLCNTPEIAKLKRLDIFHHYVSDAGVNQLKNTFPDVEIDASDVQEEDGYGGEVYRYNFVSE